MTEVRYTSEAVADLEEIFERIECDRPDGDASEFVRKVVNRARFIAKMPRIGTRRVVDGRECRMFPEPPYLLYYRVIDQGILLVRVIHGKQDQRQALGQTDQPSNG